MRSYKERSLRQPRSKTVDFEFIEIKGEYESIISGPRKMKIMSDYVGLKENVGFETGRSDSCRGHFCAGLRKDLFLINSSRQKGGPQLERMT